MAPGPEGLGPALDQRTAPCLGIWLARGGPGSCALAPPQGELSRASLPAAQMEVESFQNLNLT